MRPKRSAWQRTFELIAFAYIFAISSIGPSEAESCKQILLTQNAPAAVTSTAIPSPSLSTGPDRDEQVLNDLKTADDLMGAKKFTQALIILKHAAELDPSQNSANVHNHLGLSYESLNDVDNAIVEYKKTIVFQPDLDVGKLNLANMLCRKAKQVTDIGNYNEAQKLLETSIRLNPKIPIFHNNLGSVLQSKSDLDGAIGEYKQALLLEPNLEIATLNLAKCYVNLGQFEQARAYYEKIVKEHPNSQSRKNAEEKIEYLSHKSSLPVEDNGAPDYFKNAISTDAIKWPPEFMPLKIYIDPGSDVDGYRPIYQAALVRGFNDWSQASRYKITWVGVNSPEQANIVCTWASNNLAFVNHVREPLAQGEVSSYQTFIRNGQNYIQHANLVISTHNAISGHPMSDGEARNVALHELGHALGITGHSPNFHDIMFFTTNPSGVFTERSLSNRDAATINILYPDLRR